MTCFSANRHTHQQSQLNVIQGGQDPFLRAVITP